MLECRFCVIAGNISPIDVVTHVPILCEEAEIPYVYVPSKEVSLLNTIVLHPTYIEVERHFFACTSISKTNQQDE